MKKLLTLSLALSVSSCSPQAVQQTTENLKSSPSPSASPTPQASASISPNKVITEAQVEKDKMIPDEDDTIVIDLENKDVTSEEDDTGNFGQDIIPISYSKDLKETIKWEGDKDGSYAELKDKAGNVIYKIEQGGDTVTKDIKKGEYTLEITSNETTAKDGTTSEPVFIREQKNLSVSADENAITKLMSTKSCIECDLSWANLSNAKLIGVNLSNANLSGTKFIEANLKNAVLKGSTLELTDFTSANLNGGIDFTGATIIHTYFYITSLTGANFSNIKFQEVSFTQAYLQDANFSNANLTGTNFKRAYLYGTNFTGANITGVNWDDSTRFMTKWTNGKTCTDDRCNNFF